MTQSFSGGSARLREAAEKIDQKVKWTVRMAGEALAEVDNLIHEAGTLGGDISGINMALVASQDINQQLNHEIIGKLNRLKQILEELA